MPFHHAYQVILNFDTRESRLTQTEGNSRTLLTIYASLDYRGKSRRQIAEVTVIFRKFQHTFGVAWWMRCETLGKFPLKAGKYTGRKKTFDAVLNIELVLKRAA